MLDMLDDNLAVDDTANLAVEAALPLWDERWADGCNALQMLSALRHRHWKASQYGQAAPDAGKQLQDVTAEMAPHIEALMGIAQRIQKEIGR